MRVLIFISIILFLGCKKHYKEGTTEINEDFETYSDVQETYDNDDSKWSYYQQTDAQSSIELDTINPHTGKQSLKIFATPTKNGSASKSDIANNKMTFEKNETVFFSAWYYIEGSSDLKHLLIFDLEESVVIGAGPGIRLMFREGGYLVVERGKMNLKTIGQEELEFPTNQWVHVEFEVKLSQKKKGYVKLWQDSELIINEENIQTLPTDKLTFTQGTKGIYNSVQVGITANKETETEMYVDDILITKND